MPQHIKITVSRKTLFEDSFQQVLQPKFKINHGYGKAMLLCKTRSLTYPSVKRFSVEL